MSQITLSEKEVRIQKTHKMKKMGIHPYAQSFQKKDLISDIIVQYEGQTLRDSEEVVLNPQVQVQTAGRVMLYRSHGKLAFAKILDSSNQIQLTRLPILMERVRMLLLMCLKMLILNQENFLHINSWRRWLISEILSE